MPQEAEAAGGRCSFVHPTIWKPFLLLLAFFFFQEGSGIYVVLYYAVSLFQVSSPASSFGPPEHRAGGLESEGRRCTSLSQAVIYLNNYLVHH